jgi:hypothetical protein
VRKNGDDKTNVVLKINSSYDAKFVAPNIKNEHGELNLLEANCIHTCEVGFKVSEMPRLELAKVIVPSSDDLLRLWMSLDESAKGLRRK